MVVKIRNKKEKKNDLRYPRAVKVVTLLLVLVGCAIAGVSAYVSVSGAFLAMGLGTTLGSAMSGGGGGSGPFNMTMTNTTIKMWLVMPVNNTNSVGLDINDLVVNVSFTYDNGTSMKTTNNIGSIPFGETRMANITLLDTTLALVAGMNSTSITIAIWCSMQIKLPQSWGLFALTISDLEFGFELPFPGGISFS